MTPRGASGAIQQRPIEPERAGNEAAQRLAAIVASSDDAIVSKDLNGVVMSWNAAAERIFGYAAAEVVGRSIQLIIPAERLSEENLVLDRVRRGEVVEHFETVRRRKDGSDVHISLTVSPIRDATGAIVGASKIARDVTERKRMEADRERLLARAEQMRAEAEQANRVKDEFLATLSHELRSPLNAISGWAQLAAGLLDDTHDPTLRRALDVIQRNVSLQLRLINDLLDVSSIVNGKLPLRSDVVDVTALVGAVVDSLRPQAAAKDIRVDMRWQAKRASVIGDAMRLEQVAWNLLSNALKFTPRGGTVTITIDRVGPDVRVVVQDTGEGIAPGFLPYVFDRFRQADATTTRRHGGLGLGLAVAQHLVQAHRGRISARSPGPGLGATFTIDLPADAEIGADEEDRQDEPSRTLDGLRLLVVDDNADARDLLDSVLRRYGVDVTAVAGFEEALEAFGARPYDVMLSDLAMPHRDGFVLIEAIRRDPRPHVRRIGAIAVTAHADDAYRTRALASGFDDYLTKPVEAARLVRLIDSVRRRRGPIGREP
jgi:PAS domain S-box-containing protein